MKREDQSILSAGGQQASDQYVSTLKQEDLLIKTTRNYLSDLRQFMAWCEWSWHNEQVENSFTQQRIATSLLIRYRTYLQTTLWLKPSSINRAFMSLKRYFACAVKEQLIQDDPTDTVKFLPIKETAPGHLKDEEDVLVATVNTHGLLRDRTIITFLLHTGMRVEELCTLTCTCLHIGKRNGTLRTIGKRKKECSVPLNATEHFALLKYLETQPQESTYLFPSEKIGMALTGRTLRHLITKYTKLSQVFDVSPHDLRYRIAVVVSLH